MARNYHISGVITIALIVLLTGVLFVSITYSDDTSLLAKGKKLFEWKAPNGRSCVGCHENGKLLEKTGKKKYWTLMGVKFRRIEDVINMCRENPMGLNSSKLAPGSEEMEALKAYVFSFTK